MTDKTTDVKALLENAMLDIEQLLAALKSEYSALEKNDLTAFEKSVKQKQIYSTSLEKFEHSIFTKIEQAGYQPSQEGLMAYLEENSGPSDTQDLVSLWDRLHLITKNCQEQNLINGQIVNIASITAQQTLDLLIGRDSNTGTYDPSGKTDEDAAKNPLAIA